MEGINIFVSVLTIGSAMLFTGLSIPLVRRNVKMNKLYGVRFKKSYTSNEAWYDINEYGGRQLILWSIPILVAGVILLFIDLESSPTLTLLLVSSPAIFAGLACWFSWSYAKNYPEHR